MGQPYKLYGISSFYARVIFLTCSSIQCMWYFLYFQQQYAYVVIQALMSHLDTHVKSKPDIKAGVVDVLFESVIIAAGASVGKSTL